MSQLGPAPKVDLCQLHAFENPNKTWTVTGQCKNQKSVRFDIPVSQMDKMMCTFPDQFVDMMTYINKLMSAFKSEIGK